MNKSKVRIGVLSTANIATRSVIPAIVELKDQFELVGIASRSIEKAEFAAKKFETKPFEGYDLLVNTELIDALYIPLPNSLHYKWIKKALKNNIHVLVEKSMTCSLKETIELNNLAKKKKLVLVENFQFRHHRQLKEIKEIIDSGKIGELRSVRSYFGFPPFSDVDNIRYKKELGGGALLDAGAYPIQIAQLILGRNLSVKASCLKYCKDKGVDILGGGFLQQNEGHLFAEIAFGFDHFYQCNIELWGSKGKLYTNRIFTAPPGYEALIKLDTNADGSEEIRVKPDNHFINMLDHFYKLIQNELSPDEDYTSNINQAKLIQQFKTIAS